MGFRYTGWVTGVFGVGENSAPGYCGKRGSVSFRRTGYGATVGGLLVGGLPP
jgi:hypothetical protein